MKNQLWLLALAAILILCCCNKHDSEEDKKHDPGLPVQIETFMPDSGGIRTKFIIKGSNFGSDISKIKVLFSNDEKSATIIGANNGTIYCLVPKQSGGNNSVKIVIENDTVAFTKTFNYEVDESVSTIVGVSGAAGSIDGILSDGRVQRTFGIAAVAGGDVISFESLSGNVRLISIEDNKISTLQTGFYGGQPAITKDRKKIYSIGKDAGNHKVVLYDYDAMWEPQTIVSSITKSTALIFSCALDETEKWLYYLDKAGQFGRLELDNPSNVEILNTNTGVGATADYNYLAFSPTDNCFFVSIQSAYGIYKISKDGKVIEPYIGFNGSGTTDGTRLDCKLKSPAGITIDSEGNLYLCDPSGPTIRKYNRKSDYLSTIAGIAGTFSGIDGEPLKSTFSYPYCIIADEDDNFYIGESWGTTIRKLAIE